MEMLFPSILRNRDETIYDQINKYTKEVESTHKVPINTSKFISSVLVSPFAPNWFCFTVKNLCENYGINFIGQSDLYHKGY